MGAAELTNPFADKDCAPFLHPTLQISFILYLLRSSWSLKVDVSKKGLHFLTRN